jgi:hypothetical protein
MCIPLWLRLTAWSKCRTNSRIVAGLRLIRLGGVSAHRTQHTRPGLHTSIYMSWSPTYNSCWAVPSCPLRVRNNYDIDTMFSPNPAPSTAGSGYTRARTPQGGMSPTALSALFPSATASDRAGAVTAAEAGSQTYPVALLLTGHLRDACDNFSHIVYALAECRRQHGHCGAFLCTWTTTERLTPSHGAARHIPVDALPCVARLHRALQPISMQVQRQTLYNGTRGARLWGSTRMSMQGVRHNLLAMASCARAATQWTDGAVLSVRMRFERHFAPKASVWRSVRRKRGVITTAAAHACKANIDNVFWGDSRDVAMLLGAWVHNLSNISHDAYARHNPERGMCLAAQQVGLATNHS